MNYKLKHTRKIVLAFIIIPVVVLILTVVSIAIRQNMFEKRFHFRTDLENAIGVSAQTPVLFKGFEIGRVDRFELSDDGKIEVDFYVLKRYRHLMVESSVIYRTTIPIANKTSLEYVRSQSETSLLEEGGYIPSTDFPEGRSLLKVLSPKSSDPIAMIVENIGLLTTEINKDDNADKGVLMRILVNAANAAEKADITLDLLNQNLRELNKITANLNSDHNPDAGVVLRIVNNIADISESISGQTAAIEQLISTANLAASNYANPDSLILKMLDPQGDVLIAPLSSSLYALSGSLQETEKILGSLSRSNPELLLMINNLNEVLEKANKTLEALNNNPLLRKGITPSKIRAFSPEGRIGEVPSEN
ncbi:MAG: MlaD family protein [Candidatus Cloacimonetes bacterium]|jgi:phospholipid/cholesterol/gamma-HCH transport system substrate-binding protein|nr:MlaD family protein [Candidatus Cloacimonadota bacterium]MDY0298890.1 MlaD family protein [Candidatus Cloacimonadaceae bacterium]MCB5277950.1 MlaD family protein [Candidatus Cloacimonadota bacterium]MCK9332363.1 MlaD family protein [Candidatus Cloacimonadota bacterium]MDD2210393.1 MlaD family protein [Candidatus Cloacimonadota bacterium]